MRSEARSEPLCDDLGELESCLGVDDERSSSSRSRSLASTLLPSALRPSPAAERGLHRMQRAMQMAQEKMLILSGSRKKPQAVESSITFHEREREVGSAEWCGMLHNGSQLTATQQAAVEWAGRSTSGKGSLEQYESASVTSAAETVRGEVRKRMPVSTFTHTVTAIDNMSGICLKYNICVEELLHINKPASRALLLARKTITIPVFADEDEEKHDTLLYQHCASEAASVSHAPASRESCHAGQTHGDRVGATDPVGLRFGLPREGGVGRGGKVSGGHGAIDMVEGEAVTSPPAPVPFSVDLSRATSPSPSPCAALAAPDLAAGAVFCPPPSYVSLPASTRFRLPSF